MCFMEDSKLYYFSFIETYVELFIRQDVVLSVAENKVEIEIALLSKILGKRWV